MVRLTAISFDFFYALLLKNNKFQTSSSLKSMQSILGRQKIKIITY